MTDLFSKFDDIIEMRRALLATGVEDPFNLVMERVLSPTVAVCNGRETILLGTYNYMGMTFDPDVIAAGKEALDLIARHDFDIVLLDVHMPVMDGKEAIQRLRAEPRWKSLPVIALTADAMSGDRERYIGLGMTDYLSKPVDQRELIAKLHQVMGHEEAPAPAASRSA